MRSRSAHIILVSILVFVSTSMLCAQSFVAVRGRTLRLNNKAYYFVGTNYWYGALLALERDPGRGIKRLRSELDFLKANGVTNLRLMAGAEGSGLINGVTRVGPALQPEQGKFDGRALRGLDRALYEIGRRRMKTVIFLSNNWEWSGGFQQYLLWNYLEPDRFIREKPTWDEYRDIVARFYSCEPCHAAYRKQVETILDRTNTLTGKRYRDDPTIMSWELANEPRPMRPEANNAYKQWIADTARFIKSKDKRHLVTIGHEGWIGTQDVKLYEEIHSDKNIDYLTIHIWPKNWAWFAGDDLASQFGDILEKTDRYIAENLAVAKKLDKPMVIEEFGLPRDRLSLDPSSSTNYRDKYFAHILSLIGPSSHIAGANFWAFAGRARPNKGQTSWKPGDEYTGDPPMEEQGLNSVFETDLSTWRSIRSGARAL
jgi:mannan endo-1,4-beta-mannosidase